MRTTTTNVYQISSIRQLVDLNQEMINFNIDFNVKSENREPFECLVIDQQTLDSEENLQYKKVPGVINGSVSSYKNIYQSYYLILRSDEPCNVEVTLSVEHLDDNLPLQNDVNNSQPRESLKDMSGKNGAMKWLKNWKILFAIGVIVALIIYLYYSNQKPKQPTIVTTFYPRKIDELPRLQPQTQPQPQPQPQPQLRPQIQPQPQPQLRPQPQPQLRPQPQPIENNKLSKPNLEFEKRLRELEVDFK